MRRNPILIWLLVAVAVTVLVLALSNRFPWVLQNGDNSYHLVYLLLWLVIVGGSVVHLVIRRPARAMRDFMIWAGVFATIIVGYSYRDLFQDFGRRVRGELMPSAGMANADGSHSFKSASDGHFYIEGTV